MYFVKGVLQGTRYLGELQFSISATRWGCCRGDGSSTVPPGDPSPQASLWIPEGGGDRGLGSGGSPAGLVEGLHYSPSWILKATTVQSLEGNGRCTHETDHVHFSRIRGMRYSLNSFLKESLPLKRLRITNLQQSLLAYYTDENLRP